MKILQMNEKFFKKKLEDNRKYNRKTTKRIIIKMLNM